MSEDWAHSQLQQSLRRFSFGRQSLQYRYTQMYFYSMMKALQLAPGQNTLDIYRRMIGRIFSHKNIQLKSVKARINYHRESRYEHLLNSSFVDHYGRFRSRCVEDWVCCEFYEPGKLVAFEWSAIFATESVAKTKIQLNITCICTYITLRENYYQTIAKKARQEKVSEVLSRIFLWKNRSFACANINSHTHSHLQYTRGITKQIRQTIKVLTKL